MAKKTTWAYGLRTVDKDGRAYGGFVWPKKGKVTAPDWRPTAECGNGLHALLNGEGNSSLLSWTADALWQVVRFDATTMVELGGKVKFPCCDVIHTGTRATATACLWGLVGAGHAINSLVLHSDEKLIANGGDCSTLTGGDGSTLTGGDYSTLTGGDGSALTGGDGSTLTGGDYSTLTGGDCSTLTGGDGSTLTGGDGSKLTGGDYSTLTGGDYSTLSGGDGSTLTGGKYSTLTGGDYSTLTGGDYSTLTGGYGSHLTGGDGSCITIVWWCDGKRRSASFNQGDDYAANTPYKAICEGRNCRLERVEK